MATQMYHDWVTAGRPWKNAKPVAAYLKAFLEAEWPANTLGTIGDEAHLQADTPKDHCPFSFTGWPVPHPHPYVNAIDVGHNPSAGRDMRPIVAYWAQEGRAGRTPWVKYIIFQGISYDTRTGFAQRAASGHGGHAHVSMRSDYVTTDIGAWPILGKGQTVTDSQTGRDVWRQTVHSPALGITDEAQEWLKKIESILRQGTATASTVKAIENYALQLVQRPAGSVDALALAQALAAQPEFVDALATALAAKVGMIPTAREIAKAVGELTWHGRAD